MATIPTTEPAQIIAGDSARWMRSLADYPAPTWTLTYTLIGESYKSTFSASASGTDHAIHLLPAITSAWAAGEYALRARVSDGTDAYTIGESRVQVMPSYSATASGDMRSAARRGLAAIEAYLADPDRIASAEYTIAGRSLRRYPLDELWRHRDRLRAEVMREDQAARIAAGLSPAGRVTVRFGL